MRPSWLTVPYASSSLRSCWRNARHPPYNIVSEPTTTTIVRQPPVVANIGDEPGHEVHAGFDHRRRVQVGADRRGADHRAGNQLVNGTCADFVNAPSRTSSRATVTVCPDGGRLTSSLIRYVPAA